MARRTLEAKIDALVQEVRDFKTEMRLRDTQRAADIQRHDAEIRELRQDIKSALRHVQNLTTAAIVGIGALTASVIYFVATR